MTNESRSYIILTHLFNIQLQLTITKIMHEKENNNKI